jgi:GxxExxY protein
LLESAYRRCLVVELEQRGHTVVAEATLDIEYKGHRIPAGYRLDLLVDNTVIVEIKAIERTLPVHLAQLLTYMRLSNHRLGLLLNFNVPALRHGITRLVL